MRLRRFSKPLPALPVLLSLSALLAQNSPVLTVTPPEPVAAKAGETVTVKVAAALNEGFHLNSHTPKEDYLIPLTLKWNPGSLEALDVQYPEPHMIKAPFDPQPLSVLTGKFTLTTKFRVASAAPGGSSFVTGKLRYQACNDKSCFPPKTLEVKVPVQVR